MINDIKEHRNNKQSIKRRKFKNNLKVKKTNNANRVKDLETTIERIQTELSEANRKLAGNIKEINRLKNQINKDTDINSQPNILHVSINEDINIMRSNGNDEHFIDEFADFKKFVTVEFPNIKQKIANLNMKDHYPQGNTLNEQQEEWRST